MPRLASPNAATRNGIGSHTSATTVPAMPTASTANPRRTIHRGPRRSTTRCWIQAPAVHASVPAVRASPATQVGWSRASVTASDTKASVPKKAKVRIPRVPTAAGRPGWRVRVPSGTSRTNAHSAGVAPATISSAASAGAPAPSPASTRATPSTSTRASRRRSSSPAPAPSRSAAGRSVSTGRAIAAATAARGSRARNTTRHEDQRSIALAAAGPTRPGTTHAVENTANTRGRRSGG